MQIKRLILLNFRGARQLDIQAQPGLNVYVGENGVGKSTILDALAILLSQAMSRTASEHGKGRGIQDLDINNDCAYSALGLQVNQEIMERFEPAWRVARVRKGKTADTPNSKPDYTWLNMWAMGTRRQLTLHPDTAPLTLFAYYPVNRAVLDIPLRIRTKHTFARLEAYDGALSTGANFRAFFEWFRNREDLENERLRDRRGAQADPQLTAVRRAIQAVLPGFSELRVRRNPLRMEVKKNGRALRVDQLSDGEKCLLAMVGDLARRLAIMNPLMENALQGKGVVLIDEIELHLHPKWQRSVIPTLAGTFPNCQFFITTHSPQVLGEVQPASVFRIASDAENGLSCTQPTQTYGLDSAEILEEVMETPRRAATVDKALRDLFSLIDHDEFERATRKLAVLRKKLSGSTPELVRAEALITMLGPQESNGA